MFTGYSRKRGTLSPLVCHAAIKDDKLCWVGNVYDMLPNLKILLQKSGILFLFLKKGKYIRVYVYIHVYYIFISIHIHTETEIQRNPKSL